MELLMGLGFNKYAMGILLVTGLLTGVYFYGRSDGVHSRDKEVATLTTERNDLQAVVGSLRETVKNQHEANDKALAQLKEDNKKLLSTISGKLDASEAKARKLREALDAQTTIYVTPKADAQCIVPNGFVRLHDLPIEARPSAPTSSESFTIPSGRSEDVDSPSGIALSEVGRTVAYNYTTCEQRKAIIESWQSWYTGSLANWVKAVETQSNFKVAVPAPLH